MELAAPRRLNVGSRNFTILLSIGMIVMAQIAQSQPPQVDPAVNGGLPKDQQVLVPVIIDDRAETETMLIPAERLDESWVEASPIIEVLETKVRPELAVKIKAAIDVNGRLPLSVLRETGLQATVNPRTLDVRLTIPAEARKITDMEIFSRRPPFKASEAVKYSLSSAFLNIRSGLDYVEQTASGAGTGLQPLRIDLEGAIRIHQLVLEGAGSFYEAANSPWQRGDFRLVYDDPEHMIRYAVGDLSYPISGFQQYQPLAGFTVARNYSLQPYRTTQPVGQTSFLLRHPSKVEVLVNGRTAQTLQLPAGQHSFRDFSFVSGANDVVLKITDDVGRVEFIEYRFFFDTDLLAPGEHAFGYTIGWPSSWDGQSRTYGFGVPSASMFHRFGLTDTVTLGANLQGNDRQQMAGAECLWAGPYGIVHGELASSEIDGAAFGYAARLQYRWDGPASRDSWGGVWSVSTEYRGPTFAPLGTLDPDQRIAADFAARYSQRLPWAVNVGVGGGYQIRRGGDSDVTEAHLFGSKRWWNNLSTDLSFDVRWQKTLPTEMRVFISFTWSPRRSNYNVNGSYDSLTDTRRLNWQHHPSYNVGGIHSSLGMQQTPSDSQAFGSASYAGYRGEIGISQDVTTPGTFNGPVDSRSSLRLATALAWADGVWAVSRPIRDSFVVVTAHPALKGQTIGLDQTGDRYSAQVGRLGPGVISDLQSYQMRRITLDGSSLKPGYELGQDIYPVLPAYKSGTHIVAGTGGTVSATGRLETASGQPVSLEAGEVTSLTEPKNEPLILFTNRDGIFNVEGLVPGRYQLRFFDAPDGTIDFQIPEKTTGMYDLKVLTLPQGVKFGQ